MYTTASELGTSSVPAFLSKLWTLVEDPDTNELICWDPSGKSFHVLDQARFARETLPLYFKHNNIASFVRQLNMYGFRKVTNVEATNVKTEKDDLEFAHPYFVQGQDSSLEFIKRKVPSSSKPEVSGNVAGNEDLSKVFVDVSSLKERQESMTTKLETLKEENEFLWRELLGLRQMHNKQQQIVNKLIQFLVTMVGNERTLGSMKRKLPLMLEDGERSDSSSSAAPAGDGVGGGGDGGGGGPPPTKMHRPSSIRTLDNKIIGKMTGDNLEPLAILKDGLTPSLELTDLLEFEAETEEMATPMSQFFRRETKEEVEGRGMKSGGGGGEDVSVSSAQPPILSFDSLLFQPTNVTTVAKADLNIGNKNEFDKNEMEKHLDYLQADIDNLRDLFVSGQYSFDSNTLFELFSPDISYLSTTPNLLLEPEEEGSKEMNSLLMSKPNAESNGTVVGNELIQYNPLPEDFSSLFEEDPLTLGTDNDVLGEFFENSSLMSSNSMIYDENRL